MKIVGFPVDVSRSQRRPCRSRSSYPSRVDPSYLGPCSGRRRRADVCRNRHYRRRLEPCSLPAFYQPRGPLRCGFRPCGEPRLRARAPRRKRRVAGEPYRPAGLGPLGAIRGLASRLALCRARALRRSGGRPRGHPIAEAAARTSRCLVRNRARRSRAGVARSRARLARSCLRARQLDEHARTASAFAGSMRRARGAFTAEAIVLQALAGTRHPVAAA